MAKIVRDAALVLGAVALVATGVGAAIGIAGGIGASAGIGALGASLGVSVSTIASVGVGLEGLSTLLAKKPAPIANPMAWQSDPNAGLPIVAGRAYSSGKIFLRTVSGSNNNAESIHTCYSIGPVQALEQCYVDSIARSIDGSDNVNVPDYGKIVIATQTGTQPEPSAFGFWDSTPGLTSASKVSGLAAAAIRLYYDTKGKNTMTTEPAIGFVVQGVRVYDPRKDSTYPGGNGPQRWNDETTWSWAGYDDPYLFGLAWLIGWRQNGKLVAGVGMPLSAILVDQFVEGANVADANGWKMGGVLDTTDDKWNRLKDILQAGGGVPMRLGAQVGCIVNTPKTSLATISIDDVVGDASVQATQAQRDRINAVIPRYMAELDNTVADPSKPADSDGNYQLITNVTWAMVAASPVVVSDYVTFDGKQRQKQIDYAFVQNLTQAQQLARYDIENAREFGPISLPLKLRWMGYKPGDVVTCNLPELGLNGQDILLLQRELSPSDMTVTLTARSETAAKHAYALGQTGTPPATPTVTGPVLIPTPGASAWALTGGTLTSANGTTVPVLQIVGSVDSTVVDAVVFQYRLSETASAAAGAWIDVGAQAPSIELLNITGVQDDIAYDVSIAYRQGSGTGTPLILGPAVAGQTSVPYQTGVTGPKPPVDADNTATVFAAAGLTPEQVVQSINVDVQSFLSLSLRQDQQLALFNAISYINGQGVNAYVLNFQNEQVTATSALESTVGLIGAKSSDGTTFMLNGAVSISGSAGTLAQQLSDLEADTGTVSSKVATLEEAYLNTDGTAKSFYTLEVSAVGSNGTKVITGFNATAGSDGSTNFAILATNFEIVDDSTGTPYSPFAISSGVVTMHSVEVDTLKVNTAVVPVRSTDLASTQGAYSGAQTTVYTSLPDPTEMTSLTKTITMPVAGYIDVEAWAKLNLPSGNAPWRIALAVNGTVLPESARGGNAPNDAVNTAGSILVNPGSYTLTFLFSGHTTVAISNKSMRANGYPATEAA